MLKYRGIQKCIRERQLVRIERRKKWQKQTQTNVPTSESLNGQQQQQKK